MTLKRLEGKIILVTGSGRGFGRFMAVAYAREGARIISVSRTISELETTEKIIKSENGEVLTVPSDLSRIKDIMNLRDIVFETYGGLDVLVNNAALSTWKTIEEMTIQEWDKTINVNLRAPFVLTKAFLKSIKKRGGGSVINITSKSAEIGFVGELAYCPSKFGIEGLTQCLALELKPHNIAVNSLNVASPPDKSLKPTSLTEVEVQKMSKSIQRKFADYESMIECYGDVWVFIAKQNGSKITGQRFGTKELSQFLKQFGEEAAIQKWGGYLTKAVYQRYPMPEKVRYQTASGGWREFELS